MFFVGQFSHTLDDKGRLTIPARFRDILAAGGAYVVQGFDHNLMLFTTSQYELLCQRAAKLNITDPTARLLKRLLFTKADHVEVDRAGRILIPQFLRQQIDLGDNVVIAAVGDHFEIWPSEMWNVQDKLLQDTDENPERFKEYELWSG